MSYVFVYVSMLLSDCNVWGRIHFGNLFLEKWTCESWIWGQNKYFSENGSPGQTSMLTRRASKFWVEPRSPFSEISHHDPKTIGKTPKIVPLPECQPELLGYVHFTFVHIIFILFSHFCEICDFFMLNTGWMFQCNVAHFTARGPAKGVILDDYRAPKGACYTNRPPYSGIEVRDFNQF